MLIEKFSLVSTALLPCHLKVIVKITIQVYVKAKECSEQLSAEEFAILLGKHFTSFYPQVVS